MKIYQKIKQLKIVNLQKHTNIVLKIKAKKNPRGKKEMQGGFCSDWRCLHLYCTVH